MAWSGLGMGNVYSSNTTTMGSYVDILLAQGIEDIRVTLPTHTFDQTDKKNAVIIAVNKGARVIWGVSQNNYGGLGSSTITKENWPTFRLGILAAAQWSQDNGVYEFQIGNEEELHNHFHPSLSRTDNVVTVTTRDSAGTVCNHSFTADNQVTITGATPADLNGTFDITVTGATTFTYTANGENATVSSGVTQAYNLSLSELRDNLKSVATECQAIFIRGNISYTTNQDQISAWNTLGKGDLDLIAFNVYRGGLGSYSNAWKTAIDNIVTNWGNEAYITEWSVSYTSLNDWSTNEERVAAGIAEMLDYIQEAGISKAIFYSFAEADFGVYDGTNFKLFWNNLTTNNGRRWFINL